VTSAIGLVKSASPGTVAAVGDTVTYSFEVENQGNQTVHGITVDDPMFASVVCPTSPVAPGDHTTCTASYSTTQADLDAGSISNTATASALELSGATVTSDSSTATVTATQAPHLTLVKSASPTSVAAKDDVVSYSFHVTNDGNVTLNGIAIDDPMLSSVNCPTADLAPSDDEICTASYTVTQADVDAGSITNTATAAGATTADPGVPVISPASTAAVSVVQNAALTLTETSDIHTVTGGGQVITYTFHVVNGGNVTITGVAVQPQSFTGTGTAPTIVCPASPTSLAPGDDLTCTASYTVVASDLSLSSIHDSAIATGVVTAGSIASTPAAADVTVDPPAVIIGSGLAQTGVTGFLNGLALGFGLVVFGVALLIRRRRREA